MQCIVVDCVTLVSSSGAGTSFSRHLVQDSSTADKTQTSKRSSSVDEEDEDSTAATASQSK